MQYCSKSVFSEKSKGHQITKYIKYCIVKGAQNIFFTLICPRFIKRQPVSLYDGSFSE